MCLQRVGHRPFFKKLTAIVPSNCRFTIECLVCPHMLLLQFCIPDTDVDVLNSEISPTNQSTCSSDYANVHVGTLLWDNALFFSRISHVFSVTVISDLDINSCPALQSRNFVALARVFTLSPLHQATQTLTHRICFCSRLDHHRPACNLRA